MNPNMKITNFTVFFCHDYDPSQSKQGEILSVLSYSIYKKSFGMKKAIEKVVKIKYSSGVFSKWLFLTLLLTACGGIVPPPPEPLPEVKSTIPADQEQGVALNRSISITFNKAMSPKTVTKSTFFLTFLTEGTTGNMVPGNVTLTGTTATFKPTGLLKGSTSYIATLTTGIEDLSGNAIDQPHLWQFTTAAVGSPGSIDDTPPVVVLTIPENGAANVPTNTGITATFSEGVDPATVTSLTFDVSKGTDALDLIVSGKDVVFIPDADLELGNSFTATITTGVKDLAGNPLSEAFSWSFSTGGEPPDDD